MSKQPLFFIKDHPEIQAMEAKFDADNNSIVAMAKKLKDTLEEQHKKFWIELKIKMIALGLTTEEALAENSRHSIENGVFFMWKPSPKEQTDNIARMIAEKLAADSE